VEFSVVAGCVHNLGLKMAEGDNYLAMALNLLRRAEKLADPEKRAGLEALAEHYRIQAERVRHMSALTIGLPQEQEKKK
jgi:uncharacterized protein (DUF2235 family)